MSYNPLPPMMPMSARDARLAMMPPSPFAHSSRVGRLSVQPRHERMDEPNHSFDRLVHRFKLFNHQPVNPRFAPKPGHLPLRKSSGVAFELRDHILAPARSVEIGRNMLVPEPFHRGTIPRVASPEQNAGFFDEP